MCRILHHDSEVLPEMMTVQDNAWLYTFALLAAGSYLQTFGNKKSGCDMLILRHSGSQPESLKEGQHFGA